MADPAFEYLTATSSLMDGGYTEDCVAHACAVAELLLRARRDPWIAILRSVSLIDGLRFHHPLTPRRFTGSLSRTWNTHYVCCCDGQVYDPIVGKAIPIGEYAREVFGFEVPVREFLSPEETARLASTGELREAFRGNPVG